MFEVNVRTHFLFSATFAIAATTMMATKGKAQDAEPRSYTNTPIGLNFLIAGYRAGLGDAAAEVLRLVSRDLERASVAPPSSARRTTPLSAVE